MRDPGTAARFATTHWSLVLRARGDGEEARSALEELLATWWEPLYAHLRRQGHRPEDAQDLVQGFLGELCANATLERIDADPAAGRLRAFLKGGLDHYVSRARAKDAAQKRGGGAKPLPLDAARLEEIESTLAGGSGQAASTDSSYVRDWATTLLGEALGILRREYDQRGRGTVLRRIERFLDEEPGPDAYAKVAHGLGASEGAVKVSVHRMRRRFGEIVRGLVAATVRDQGEVEDEVGLLIAACRDTGSWIPREPVTGTAKPGEEG